MRAEYMNSHKGTPGVNLDKVNVQAGLNELVKCGYTDSYTTQVIEYALMRHARGEESAAQRGAIDETFHGINLTSWTRVLAAAISSAQ